MPQQPRTRPDPQVRKAVGIFAFMVAVFLLYLIGFWNALAGAFIRTVFSGMKKRLPPPKKPR